MAKYPIDIEINTGKSSSDLNKVNDSLDKTESAARAAAIAANNLSDAEQSASKSAQQLAQQQQTTATSTRKVSNEFEGLATAAKGFIALAAGSQVAQWGKEFLLLADNINLLQSRLSLYTKSQAETNAVFADLQIAANKAGTSLQDTAQTFTQFASAGKDLGVTNQQVLQLVTNLQTMGKVSGASGQAASAAIYQLSQSFASGRLQGDEFRSISEQLPVVLDVLSKKLGVTRGELRQMATDGKLSSDTLLLLAGDMSDLEAQAAKLPRTIEQASAALTNNLGVAADALNDKLGLSQGVAKSIDAVSSALDYWTKKQTGAITATDELNRVLATQNGTLSRQQDAYDGLNDKTSMYAKYLQEQINKQKAAIAETENQITAMQRLSGLAAQLASDIQTARNAPKTPTADSDAQKTIDSLSSQIKYTKALADGNYELAASSKLGTKATAEQVKAYAELLRQQTEYKQSVKDTTKSTREQESAANRVAKELERNQQANEKYIKSLNDKVAAGDLDLKSAQASIQLAHLQATANDNQVGSIQKLVEIQNQAALAAQQREAQSRLNKDATDQEKASVDALVASLYAQQQAKQAGQQYAQLTSDLTSAGQSPEDEQLADIGAQEAQRYIINQQARQQDLIDEQEYQDTRNKIAMDAATQRRKVELTQYQQRISASQSFFDTSTILAKQFAGEQSGIYKAMYAASRAAMIANVVISTIQNVAEASKVGFPWNIITIAGAVAQGVGLLAQARGTPSNFADGGLVTGMGTGRSDSIPASLSDGEFVSTAQATGRYRSTLESMNAGTYTEGTSNGTTPNVTLINQSSQQLTASVQSVSREEVVIMLQDMVPDIVAAEINDPYSGTSKNLNSSYQMQRNL